MRHPPAIAAGPAMAMHQAVVVVMLSFFFGMESAMSHAVLTGLPAGMLAFVLTLALLLQHPFAGDLHLDPDAYSTALEMIENA